MKKLYNIAVIGVTGNVGSTIFSILYERDFPINNIYAIASTNSIGKKISFGEKILQILPIENFDFKSVDIAFFAAGSAVSQKYVPIAVNSGCTVIDKSSYYRMDCDVPLIVPEANIRSIENYQKRKIIASPNCCAIPLAVVLKPLDDIAKIKRVVISTYQSTSGAGRYAMDELYNQTKAKYSYTQHKSAIFPKQIAFNLFPQIGDFNEDGSTTEESKIISELQKILGSHIQISITCVRVPVFIGHAIAVNIEFADKVDVEKMTATLSKTSGVVVLTLEHEQKYCTPIDAVGEDSVYVSRIRKCNSLNNSINLWITVDNLRKGAALNAVQIAESLIS